MSQPDSPAASGSGARITELLANKTLGRLKQLRLQPRGKFTNRQTGEHLAGAKGRSNEFADYRDYAEGDDIRAVDWNIFARLHRPFVKLFYEEQEKHVVVIVDNSRSMDFENKFLRARQLGLALGFTGLLGGERVSMLATNPSEEFVSYQPPTRGRGNFPKLIAFMENLRCGGDTPPEEGIANLLKRHTGQGLAIVLSDYLSSGDMKRGFNRLFNAGLEPCAVHILGPAELDPEINGDVSLVDSELGNRIDISASSTLLQIYHDYLSGLQHQIETLCRQRSGRYVLADAGREPERILFETLRREGWLS